MAETENPNPSFDNLPREVAGLHAKIDRLMAMIERFISSADTNSLPEIMTVEDVAAMLCKSVSTIYTMTSEKRIPHHKRGNKLYFFVDEIIGWIEQGETLGTGNEDEFNKRLEALRNGRKRKPGSSEKGNEDNT